MKLFVWLRCVFERHTQPIPDPLLHPNLSYPEPYKALGPLPLSPPPPPHSWGPFYPLLSSLPTQLPLLAPHKRHNTRNGGTPSPSIASTLPSFKLKSQEKGRASDMCCAWAGSTIFGKLSLQLPKLLPAGQEFLVNNWTKPEGEGTGHSKRISLELQKTTCGNTAEGS